MLVLAPLACVEGCRRNTGVKKPGVKVNNEKDFIFGNRPDDILAKLEPLPKETPVVDAAVQEAKQKAEEEAAKQKRRKDTLKLGQAFVEFCNQTPNAKDQSLDKFKTHLRRAKLENLRAEVDKDIIEVMFLSVPTLRGHILTRYKTESNGSYTVFEVGGLASAEVNFDDLEERVQKQELITVWRQVWGYAMPHFVTTPADPGHAARLKAHLAKGTSIADIVREMPQYVKNPPAARDPDKFKKYLRENARPAILQALEESKLRVNVNADFCVATDLVVCQVKAESTDKGNLTITSSGAINYYAVDVIAKFFK